jgi:predicted Zn-dependent protease
MDRLDKISLWAIVVLLILSSALISHNMGEAKPGQVNTKRTVGTVTEAPAELKAKVNAIKNIMESGNFSKAELLVRELIGEYPYEGEPRMLMGDLFMRRQEAINAALEYREAVDLNPDYLDRKTPLFQGKKLKSAVKEALHEADDMIRKDSGVEDIKKKRKTIYYLQRRIAGSCG